MNSMDVDDEFVPDDDEVVAPVPFPLSFLHDESVPKELPKKNVYTTDIELNEKQHYALDSIIKGESVFITGASGTGKSAMIATIARELRSRGDKVAITSAGLNGASDICGQTLQFFSGIKKLDVDRKILEKEAGMIYVQKIWNDIDVIIVDDISLMLPYEFQNILFVALKARTKSSVLQWVLCGDFLSISPRSNKSLKDQNPNQKDFCFQLEEWSKLIHRTIVLTEDMRRKDASNKDEKEFSDILKDIRMGSVNISNWSHKFQSQLDVVLAQPYTKLYSKFELVDAHNNVNFKKLKTKEYSFQSQKGYRIGNQVCPLYVPKSREHLHKDVLKVIEKFQVNEFKKRRLLQFLERFAVVDSTVVLRVGAVVILMANLQMDHGLVKGSQGVVTGFTLTAPFYPIVKFDHCECVIRSYMWSLDYSEGTKLWFAQIPLKLGWAYNINRMRGMTFSRVEVNTKDMCETGKVYDVLSKVRTISGLAFTQLNWSANKANPSCVTFYQNGSIEWDAAFMKWKKQKKISTKNKVVKSTSQDIVPKAAFNMDNLQNIRGASLQSTMSHNKTQKSHEKSHEKPHQKETFIDEDHVEECDSDDHDSEKEDSDESSSKKEKRRYSATSPVTASDEDEHEKSRRISESSEVQSDDLYIQQ